MRLRLICSAASGTTSIYALVHDTASTWSVTQPPVVVDTPARPIPGGCFVLDAKTGTRCLANRQGLATVLQAEGAADADRKFVLVAAGAKGVRCTLGINGEKIAKVDWGSKVGTVQHVEVVQRSGE